MLKFIDLFCGAGFGARGAVRGGGVPLLGLDAWGIATKNYKANFPLAETITSRIEDIDVTKVSLGHKPDVLISSPECTSHSIARGAKPGSEKSRETALSIIPWVKKLAPRWVIVENVNRMKRWERHDELIKHIEKQGYSISDLLLDSADFGMPQARKRMFLICDKKGIAITREMLLRFGSCSPQVASDIIAWEAGYSCTKLYKTGRAKPTIERAKRAITALGRKIPFIIVYYGSDYAGGWQPLDVPLRTITTLDRFGLVTWKHNIPYLRMLQPSELSKAMGGGSEHILPFGNRREKVKLCGNGVCAAVMTAIFKCMVSFHQA